MKETAHTPEPWQVEYPYGSRRPKVTAERTTICDVGFELMEREVDHANAALIAAAPETARKLAEAGARIEKLKEALESAEPYWRLGNGSLVAECEFALKFDGVEDCKRCSYKPSQCQCEP